MQYIYIICYILFYLGYYCFTRSTFFALTLWSTGYHMYVYNISPWGLERCCVRIYQSFTCPSIMGITSSPRAAPPIISDICISKTAVNRPRMSEPVCVQIVLCWIGLPQIIIYSKIEHILCTNSGPYQVWQKLVILLVYWLIRDFSLVTYDFTWVLHLVLEIREHYKHWLNDWYLIEYLSRVEGE